MAMLNNQRVNATHGMCTSFLECSNLVLLHVMFPEKTEYPEDYNSLHQLKRVPHIDT